VKKAKLLYNNTCKTCHGEDRNGGVGPSIVDAGQRILFDDFKNLLTAGRGRMPGFVHIDEQSAAAIYRYLGGDPTRRFNFRRRGEAELAPEGPIVASGGAPIKPDSVSGSVMADYPEGVDHPQDRYTTDYGIMWPHLLSPTWSWVMAYDLNTGTVKWKQPVGEGIHSEANEEKLGVPSGAQRKGMVITSTGILFCTGKGGKLYAYDSENGTLLWEINMNHESNAQPTMFELNGKQYLVINATGYFSRDTNDRSREPGALPRGYVVYALRR
jgi:quinoprotein glucose dehydrogenase